MANLHCIDCGDELPFEDFGDGVFYSCAACRASDSTDYPHPDDDEDDY